MKIFAAIAIAAALLLTGCSTARPLHRSTVHIRAALLKKTPVGTSEEDVQNFIKKEGWKGDDVNVEPGKIVVYFGSYTVWDIIPVDRGVWGMWIFNDNGRLIDIQVTKETDSL